MLKGIMKRIDYTDAEIAEVFENRPAGDKIYILHGYWNTPDYDGIKIVATSYEFNEVKKALDKIVESNASEFVNLTEDNWEAAGGDRFYEIIDDAGNYAKFYITKEVADYEE